MKVKMALLAIQRFPWERGVSSWAFLKLGEHELTCLLALDAVLRQAFDRKPVTAFYRDRENSDFWSGGVGCVQQECRAMV